MHKTMLMNFTVNKERRQIDVKREFNAPLPLVWSAWTERELLDKWWAPKPWQARTKSMNFSPGGSWLYAMIGPNGEEHWSKADYLAIDPQKSFTGLDGFCDENGIINDALPRSRWDCTFTDQGETTLVHIVTTYDKLTDLEQTLAMGFQEGFTAGLANLDAYLSTLPTFRE